MAKRLALLALLAGVLAAVPGPHEAPGRPFPARTAGSRSSARPAPDHSRRS